MIASWLGVLAAGWAGWGDQAGAEQLRGYRALRYDGVVAQSSWHTCGPASLATLLVHFYDWPATEREMAWLALTEAAGAGDRAMGAAASPVEAADMPLGGGDRTRHGFSMLALKRSLAGKGIPSAGYRISVENLARYFERGGLPLIAHVARPRLHYVVAVGLAGQQLVVADPSAGLRIIPLRDLQAEKGFSGHVLVPLPPPAAARTAYARQQEMLRKAQARLARLQFLRGGAGIGG